ncbi:rho-related BTB domain-containing protein 1-like protein [Dinothrombium tinctorium]|uniref:Rho-related BTB domain-containing protein 1-like protein n=1 Tax=Dinothrombium tinctorium TaxID=1965070 RepID=A0A3S3SE86_9ACAR|nr:rho-related BTB domain-containing protein 1-like protein [Dinothrombium tinctorium]RWS14090.1 rho-related BTB domain-containing protein 1-like protein [Dinothrombium tinctorium]RWS14864.1 rho-related BTB domain-containing protein 1-like protein [Dinothrombium tinctorium]
MDNEQPHQELVKCVVVGDTAVGKTRLICARACNSKLDISQVLTTHVPTVWAIDQYRMRKDVLERSCEVVDKVSVSLRLWDTFGDHEKDRRFAYGRSDVVLLCFSIANPISLRNCKAVWYPEIRKFCPTTPIVLVACKNDLRYMYRDEKFLKMWRERSPFFRPLRESDILTPEQGRSVASEINAPYYESSAFTHFGVNEVFENVIRIALIARRQQRFWMTNLKPVQSAMLQKPFCPPRPNPPKVIVPPSSFEDHMLTLLNSEAFTDTIMILGNSEFALHKIILSAASSLMYTLFMQEIANNNEATISSSSVMLARSASDSSISSSVDNSSSGNFNADTELLISKDAEYRQCQPSLFQCAYFKTALWSLSSTGGSRNNNNNLIGSVAKRFASCANFKDNQLRRESIEKTTIQRPIQHPLFQMVSSESCANGEQYRKKSSTSAQQTVLSLSQLITKDALKQCLHFMYTGCIEQMDVPLCELLDAAELFQLDELVAVLKHIEINQLTLQEYFEEKNYENKYIKGLQSRLKNLLLQNLFADVCFQFDDGVCFAHKPMLMARCDMMEAMFKGYFRESSAKVVQFPGVSSETFRQFLHYIYSDELDNNVNANTCLNLLELANRLCLPHLVSLIENKVIKELDELSADGIDITEHALKLLEPCQMHNADQLAEWCLYQITIHYKEISHKNMKLLRSLHPENQAYLNRNRWPPVWYLKELDYYERCVREKLLQKKGVKRHRNTGCLCFSGKSKRKDRIDF